MSRVDSPETPSIGRAEFVAMVATLFATVAFAIDAMLPALPDIADALSPAAPNAAQLVITAFVLGMGVGTFLAGPLSDAFGRKPVILAGLAFYAGAAIVASIAGSLEVLLAARVVQGLGAACPRIVSQALIRDLFAGRQMAQIMSFVMMIFILIPAMAPAFGQVVIWAAGWRAVFWAFVAFAGLGAAWLALRQPETLPPGYRRPLAAGPLRRAVREVAGRGDVRIYTAVLTLGFGQMFAMLSSIQQIYEVRFGIVTAFPLWFMGMALLAGTGSVVNARMVMRLGMRRLATFAYGAQALLSVAVLAAFVAGLPPGLAFPVFYGWSVSLFFMVGLTFGNLNSLALEPLGHIAGLAASVIGAVSTVGAVVVAVPIGLLFDGTPVPVIAGTLVCSVLAWGLMRRTVEG